MEKVKTPITTRPITLEQLKNAPEDILLAMIEEASEYTGKDFSDYMGVEYSYGALTNELTKRGYENGWHQKAMPIATNEVIVSQAKETERQAFTVSKTVNKRWKERTKHVRFNNPPLK